CNRLGQSGDKRGMAQLFIRQLSVKIEFTGNRCIALHRFLVACLSIVSPCSPIHPDRFAGLALCHAADRSLHTGPVDRTPPQFSAYLPGVVIVREALHTRPPVPLSCGHINVKCCNQTELAPYPLYIHWRNCVCPL